MGLDTHGIQVGVMRSDRRPRRLFMYASHRFAGADEGQAYASHENGDQLFSTEVYIPQEMRIAVKEICSALD